MTLRSARRGYGLLEGLLSIALLAAVIVGTTRYIGYAATTQQARILATRLSIMSQAADAYLKKDGTLSPTSTPKPAYQQMTTAGAVMVIPMVDGQDVGGLDFGVASLQAAGVLGQGFRDENGYGQKTALMLVNPAGVTPTGLNYEAFLVTYGGEAAPDAVMTYAEGMSEGRVGAILNDDVQGSAGGVVARGARGGWVVPLTTLQQGGLTVGPGHLVSYVSLEKGSFSQTPSGNQFLARNNTGNPDDNAMQVDIDMRGSGIDDTDHVSGSNGVLTLSGNSGSGPAAGAAQGGTVLIAGDASVTGQVNAGGAVTSNDKVVAPTFYAPASGTTPDYSYFLALNAGNNDPDGAYNNSHAVTTPDCTANPTGCGTNIKRLHADALDLNTLAFSSAVGADARQFPAGLTVADLLPNQVNKASFLANDGATIPKPNCGGATGNPHYELAKIFAYPTGMFNASAPATSVNATVDYRQLGQVVTDVELTGTSPNYVINTTTDPDGVKSFEGLTMSTDTTAANMYVRMSASPSADNSSWTLALRTYATDQNGTAFAVQDNVTLPDGQVHHNEALVQTACIYQ